MSIAAAEIRLDKRVTSFVKERRKLLIDGKWVDAASGKTFPVHNPATSEVRDVPWGTVTATEVPLTVPGEWGDMIVKERRFLPDVRSWTLSRNRPSHPVMKSRSAARETRTGSFGDLAYTIFFSFENILI